MIVINAMEKENSLMEDTAIKVTGLIIYPMVKELRPMQMVTHIKEDFIKASKVDKVFIHGNKVILKVILDISEEINFMVKENSK